MPSVTYLLLAVSVMSCQAQYGPVPQPAPVASAYNPAPVPAPVVTSYNPAPAPLAPFSRTFQPMSFQPFSFGANFMKQTQQSQGQQQTQGQSASTGDATADEGEINSAQVSNTNTTNGRTVSVGGSQGQCKGGNCALNGAAQIGTQGAFQGQKQTMGTFGTGQQQGQMQNSGFPSFGLFLGNQNTGLQSQFQSQFQNQGSAAGTGSVDKGAVSSNQNTVGETNKYGTRVDSTSLGQGAGLNIKTSGAVQAGGSGQVADQTEAGTDLNTNTGVSDGGATGTQGMKNSTSLKKQTQSQSQGTGAAQGEGSAVEGTASSGQNSNVVTNAKGTSVNSNSIGTASGKGIRISGAATSGGSSQGQKTKQIDWSLFNMNGLSGNVGGGVNLARTY